MMGDDEVWRAMEEKDELLARADEEFDAERYAELEDMILTHDGYALESRAAEVLEGLGIPAEVHRQPLSTLSGGFKLRVLLAQVLAAKPDALLLDEPTNHLDILSIRWLEKFLQGYEGIAVVVSHDHRFLDNVCNHIVDVDYETATPLPGQLHGLRGGQARAPGAHGGRAGAPGEEDRRSPGVRRPLPRQGHQGAPGPEQGQADREDGRRPEPVPQSSRRYPTFKFRQRRPSGKEVLVLEGISKAYGDNQVLEGVSLDRAARRPAGDHRAERHRQVDPAQDRHGRGEGGRGQGRVGLRDPPWLLRAGPPGALQGSRQSVEAWLWQVRPGRADRLRARQLGAVLFSGDEVKKTRRQPLGRRGRAPRLLAPGGREAERAGARRADQPPRPRGDRGPGDGAQGLRRHADLGLPRPLVRLPARRPDRRDLAHRHRGLPGQLRRVHRGAAATTTWTPTR